jgi:hypothetical protein
MKVIPETRRAHLILISTFLLSVTTVTTYTTGLGHAHNIKNLTDNAKSFIVCKMLEGLRRKIPTKSLNHLIHSLSRRF